MSQFRNDADHAKKAAPASGQEMLNQAVLGEDNEPDRIGKARRGCSDGGDR